MSEDLISEYIDIPAVEAQTKQFIAELKKIDAAFENTAKNRVTLGNTNSLNQTAAASKALQKELDGLVKSTTALKQANDQLLISASKSEKASVDDSRAKQAEAKASEAVAKAKIAEARAARTVEQSKKNDTKLAADLTNDYLQLSRGYNEAALRAKNYALQLGESHPVTVEAVKDAKTMYDTLYKIDQSVGQNQRNVGNYKSAFDGLGMSFAQVSRELPSLTVSTQQFFLAISNNLPMVFDELKKAKVEIASLKAQGMETQSLMGRIGSSLFSWQVFLSIGITLLTAYGKEIGNWIGSLFKANDAIDEHAKSQELLKETLNDSGGEYQRGIALITELTDNIQLAKNGFLDKKKVLEQYNETIGQTTGEVKTLEAAEKALIDNHGPYLRMLLLKTAAESARAKGAAELVKAEEANMKDAKEYKSFWENFRVGTTGREAADVAKKNAESAQKARKNAQQEEVRDITAQGEKLNEIAEKFQREAAEIAKQFNFDFFGGEQEAEKDKSTKNKKLFADELQDRADQLKEYSKIEILTLKTRQAARSEAFAIEQQITSQQRALDLDNAKGDKDEILMIEQKFAFDQRKIREELNKDLYEIGLSHRAIRKRQQDQETEDNARFLAELAAREKATQDQQLKNITEGTLKRKLELEKARDILLTNLEDQHTKGLISDKEYQEQRLKIEKEYLLLIIKAEIEAAEAIFALRRALGQDVRAQEAALHEIKLKYARLAAELGEAEHHKNLKRLRETLEVGKQVYAELSAFAIGMVSALTDRQKNAIQDQIDRLEQQKQKDIEVANASIANQQDRAAAITVINARAQAQREALEMKQRNLDIQRAKFEKAANIGKIIIETALAVVHQLTSGDPYTAVGRALAVGGIGAGQLAVAIAAPIPRFRKGREDGPATLGIVGDGGKHEVVASKDMKQAYITPATDTLTYLNAGDRVFPSIEDFQKKAAELSYRPVMRSRDTQFDEAKLAAAIIQGSAKGNKELINTIKNKKELHLKGSYSGVMAMHKHAQSYWKYIEEQVNF